MNEAKAQWDLSMTVGKAIGGQLWFCNAFANDSGVIWLGIPPNHMVTVEGILTEGWWLWVGKGEINKGEGVSFNEDNVW